MDDVRLIIGNKNYSSWSLRAWLILQKSGVPFREQRIVFDTEEFKQVTGQYSPTGLVPVLVHDTQLIWESLSICEYVNERFARGRFLPEDMGLRAMVRSVSCEMYAGFQHLREQMPMNCRATGRRVDVNASLQREIDRVQDIWCQCRALAGEDGGWLLGSFSIADAMFAPVVLRFITYGVPLKPVCQDYLRFVLDDADIQSWIEDGTREKEVIEDEEVGIVNTV